MATTDRVSLPGTRVTTTDRIGQTVVLGGAAFAVSFSVIATETISFIGASEARVNFSIDATTTLVMVASVILADFEFPAQATTTFTAQSTASVPFNFAASGLFSFAPDLGFDMRNAIINGNFDFWQRATSQTANGYGSADRWAPDSLGSTKTFSQQAFTLGQTDVPFEPTYFCRTVVSTVAGAGNYASIFHAIESVRTFAGQSAVLTFWAKADASKNMAVEFEQIFGTGGSPSSPVNGVGVTTCALTTSWQKFTVPVSVPSISGKTIGSNNNDYLRVRFWFDAGSTFNSRTNTLGQQNGTFDIAQVQMEPNSVATPFEFRSLNLELALCQRYYERVDSEIRFDSTLGSATVMHGYMSFFVVIKRATPALAVVTETGANSNAISALIAKSFSGFLARWEWTTDGVVTRNKAFIVSADAELS